MFWGLKIIYFGVDVKLLIPNLDEECADIINLIDKNRMNYDKLLIQILKPNRSD